MSLADPRRPSHPVNSLVQQGVYPTLHYGADELALEITDDGQGPGHSTPDTGFGLAGMRERVALLHGEFTAEPRPEGGFRVAARLPVPAGVR